MSKPKNDPSLRVTFEAYERLRNDRFFKYDEEQVNYRESEGPERCGGCVHFFKRVLDGFGVCEVFRPTTAEESVLENFVCDFQTKDGEDFPLLDD